MSYKIDGISYAHIMSLIEDYETDLYKIFVYDTLSIYIKFYILEFFKI